MDAGGIGWRGERQHKVRAIGSSTFPAEQIVEAQWVAQSRGRERFRCEQPPYSIFVRGIEASVLPTCQKYGMGVIAWSPLAGGWLTGRIRRDTGVDMSTGRARRLPQRFDPSLPGNLSLRCGVVVLVVAVRCAVALSDTLLPPLGRVTVAPLPLWRHLAHMIRLLLSRGVSYVL